MCDRFFFFFFFFLFLFESGIFAFSLRRPDINQKMLPKMTMADLSERDGFGERPAYIAVGKFVYDLGDVRGPYSRVIGRRLEDARDVLDIDPWDEALQRVTEDEARDIIFNRLRREAPYKFAKVARLVEPEAEEAGDKIDEAKVEAQQQPAAEAAATDAPLADEL
jgi:hypothetical protein